jgi:hypothetical protein
MGDRGLPRLEKIPFKMGTHTNSVVFIADPLQPIVRVYFTGSIPRSLQIFLARVSLISLCRGMDERLF